MRIATLLLAASAVAGPIAPLLAQSLSIGPATLTLGMTEAQVRTALPATLGLERLPTGARESYLVFDSVAVARGADLVSVALGGLAFSDHHLVFMGRHRLFSRRDDSFRLAVALLAALDSVFGKSADSLVHFGHQTTGLVPLTGSDSALGAPADSLVPMERLADMAQSELTLTRGNRAVILSAAQGSGAAGSAHVVLEETVGSLPPR